MSARGAWRKPVYSPLTRMRRLVAGKVARMSPARAQGFLDAIEAERLATVGPGSAAGGTIFHPAIRELTGGPNSQSINEWVIGKLAERARGEARRLNHCRGSGTYGKGGPSGGAHWTNKTRCPFCGKDVMMTKDGRMRAHGTVAKVAA